MTYTITVESQNHITKLPAVFPIAGIEADSKLAARLLVLEKYPDVVTILKVEECPSTPSQPPRT